MHLEITSDNSLDKLTELSRQIFGEEQINQRNEIFVPSSIGQGKLSVKTLRNNFELFSADGLGCKENVLVDFTCKHEGDPFIFTFIGAGNPVWRLKGITSSQNKEINAGAVLRLSGAPEELFLSHNQSASFYNILVKEDFFNYSILGLQENDQDFLYKVKERKADEHYLHLPELSADIRTVLFQINANNFSGILKNIFLESKVLELIALFFAQTVYDHKQSKKLRKIELESIYEARDILLKNIENPPTILELARLVGLNETKLRLGFKQEFNTTVYDYLRKLRMQQARILMLEEELNVSEAGVAVGYSNISHFARAFKQEFGLNPSEMMKYN